MSSTTGPAEARGHARSRLAVLGAVATAAAFVAWQLLLHRLISSDPHGIAAELLVAAPLLLFVAWIVSRSRLGFPGAVIAFIAGVAGCFLWNRSGTDAILPVLPHLIIYLLLLGWFGASLRPGREPLVTYMARHVHDSMSAELLA